MQQRLIFSSCLNVVPMPNFYCDWNAVFRLWSKYGTLSSKCRILIVVEMHRFDCGSNVEVCLWFQCGGLIVVQMENF